MDATSPTWWEKTVEYKFVVECLPDLAHAFPLDGTPETSWGDLLLKDEGSSFRLIEFKRSKAEIWSEKKKFVSMGKGGEPLGGDFEVLLTEQHASLQEYAGYYAHLLIYGEWSGSLKLRSRQYGATDAESFELSRDTLKAITGVGYKAMFDYLVALEQAHGVEGGKSSGGTICGVTKDGGQFLMSAEDFRAPELVFQRERLDPSPAPARRSVDRPKT